MEIGDISTTLERRADDLGTWEARMRRPLDRNKEWKVLSGNIDLLSGKIQLIIPEFLRQWAELVICNYYGKGEAFATLPLTS